MRVVTLGTTHVPFGQRMMLGQTELSLNVNVTLVTRGRIFARINNELTTATPRLNMFAAWAVTGFTAGLARHGAVFRVDP